MLEVPTVSPIVKQHWDDDVDERAQDAASYFEQSMYGRNQGANEIKQENDEHSADGKHQSMLEIPLLCNVSRIMVRFFVRIVTRLEERGHKGRPFQVLENWLDLNDVTADDG